MKRVRMRRLFHLDRFGKRMEESVDEEVRFHLETRIEQLVAGGLTPEAAREKVLENFGDPELVVQRCRRIDRRGLRQRIVTDLFSDLLQDVRVTLRGLRGATGFALVAILSLAVGIGVNTAVFTTIQAVWLAPVPGMMDQDRIVDMVPVIRGGDEFQWAYPDFEDVRNAGTPFESLAAWAIGSATVGAEEGGVRARVGYATPGYFRVHGAQPTVGRGFLESEGRGQGQHPVVVVSHHFWRESLDGRPDILGQPLLLDGTPYTIVGAAPEGFRGARVNLWSLDLWVPLSQHPDAAGEPSVFRDRGRLTVQVMGRLRPGATVSEARAAVQTVFTGLASDYPETNEYRGVKAVRFGRFPAQNRDLEVFAVVAICGLFAILLLIICGNLAGMVMARAASREQEIGVRLALGSSRVRLVRHLMVEAGILTLVGGAIGIALAMILMTRVSPMDLNITAPGAAFRPSGWALIMSLGVSFVAAQGVGLLPALRFSRPELVSALKDDSGGGGRRVGRLQRYASSVQTGVAFAFLLMAALFFRSLDRADESLMGFEPGGMAVADFEVGGTFLGFLNPSDAGYPTMEEGGSALVDRLMEAMEAIPGVSSVALSTGFPLDRRRAYLRVSSTGEPSQDSVGVTAEYTLASEEYFTVLGIPVLQGRSFSRADDRSAPRVAVVSRSFADRLWPGEDPLGRRVSRVNVDEPVSWTVVGVVGNVASSVAKEELPQMFIPLRQSENPDYVIVVRSAAGSDPSALSGPIREAMRSVDSDLPLPRVIPAETFMTWATQEQRTGGQVSGGLGLMILLLAAMGVYGVVALTVAHRTREIGIRIAMGATRGAIVRGVFGDALRMAGPGLLVGGILAAGIAAALRSLLLGLSPVDPLSFISVGGLLILVVVLASLTPALRASGIHPMEALRKD